MMNDETLAAVEDLALVKDFHLRRLSGSVINPGLSVHKPVWPKVWFKVWLDDPQRRWPRV
jgi:hypothetical protein